MRNSAPESGDWFNIKMLSYQYRKSHCGDKTILRPSYLHNGISYAGKTTSLYWIRAQVSNVWVSNYIPQLWDVITYTCSIALNTITCCWRRSPHVCIGHFIAYNWWLPSSPSQVKLGWSTIKNFSFILSHLSVIMLAVLIFLQIIKFFSGIFMCH